MADYAVWLCPPEQLAEPLDAVISACAARGRRQHPEHNVAAAFPAHCTIVAGLPREQVAAGKQLLLEVAGSADAKTAVRVAHIAQGDAYYKRHFVRLQRTPALLAMAEAARQATGTLDTFPLDAYDPHVSLMYADGMCGDVMAEMGPRASRLMGTGWSGGRLCLVDCSEPDTSAWRVCESVDLK